MIPPIVKFWFWLAVFLAAIGSGVMAEYHHTEPGWLAGFMCCWAGDRLFCKNIPLVFEVFGDGKEEQ